MLKSAPSQKGNKTTGKGDKNAATGDAPVKPVSGKANAVATKATKAEATVPAAPTRDVQSAGKNANKNSNVKANAAPAKTNSTPTKAANTSQNSKANTSKGASKTPNKGNAPTDANSRQIHVGVPFLLRLVLDLAPETRASCQLLREILSHERTGRLVLTSTNKGLQPAFRAVASDWTAFREDQLQQMARQTQSDKFQEAMEQLCGEYLYDAIRTQLKEVGGASVWETAKDKPALQAKNLRSRSGSANQSVKPQKPKQQQQTAKKIGPQVQSVKKNIPEKVGQVPPPAPVTAKSATAKKEAAPVKKEATPVKKDATPVKKDAAPVKKDAAPGKKDAAPVKKEIKKEAAPKNKGQNLASEKNAAPVKIATPAKNAPAKNVTAGSIVNNAQGGRATVSKAK